MQGQVNDEQTLIWDKGSGVSVPLPSSLPCEMPQKIVDNQLISPSSSLKLILFQINVRKLIKYLVAFFPVRSQGGGNDPFWGFFPNTKRQEKIKKNKMYNKMIISLWSNTVLLLYISRLIRCSVLMFTACVRVENLVITLLTGTAQRTVWLQVNEQNAETQKVLHRNFTANFTAWLIRSRSWVDLTLEPLGPEVLRMHYLRLLVSRCSEKGFRQMANNIKIKELFFELVFLCVCVLATGT